MILGLCGRKHHGKDTLADIFIKHNPTYRKLSFARRLKDICIKIYGLNEAQVSDEIGKEMQLPFPMALDQELDALAVETGLEVRRHGLVAKTPREVLQFIGTDYIRSVQPNFWLDYANQELARLGGTDFVFTDVRFGNEAEWIHSGGGKVIRIVRLAQALKEKAPEHASERLDFEQDYTLATTEGDLSILHLVAICAQCGALELALGALNWDAAAFLIPFMHAYYDEIMPEMAQATRDAFFSETIKCIAKL